MLTLHCDNFACFDRAKRLCVPDYGHSCQSPVWVSGTYKHEELNNLSRLRFREKVLDLELERRA